MIFLSSLFLCPFWYVCCFDVKHTLAGDRRAIFFFILVSGIDEERVFFQTILNFNLCLAHLIIYIKSLAHQQLARQLFIRIPQCSSIRSIFRDFVSLALPIYMLNLISFDRARRAPLLSMSLRKYFWIEMRIKEKKKENEKRSRWTFQAARKARECIEPISVWGNRYVRTQKRGASRVRSKLEGEEHGSWVRFVWFVNKL